MTSILLLLKLYIYIYIYIIIYVLTLRFLEFDLVYLYLLYIVIYVYSYYLSLSVCIGYFEATRGYVNELHIPDGLQNDLLIFLIGEIDLRDNYKEILLFCGFSGMHI